MIRTCKVDSAPNVNKISASIERRSRAGSFLDFRFSVLGAGTPTFAQGCGGVGRWCMVQVPKRRIPPLGPAWAMAMSLLFRPKDKERFLTADYTDDADVSTGRLHPCHPWLKCWSHLVRFDFSHSRFRLIQRVGIRERRKCCRHKDGRRALLKQKPVVTAAVYAWPYTGTR